ncbi:hypothetical protein [Haloplanus aerogenes]|uniref:Uncharacterized protein n=1 Tax=Haloplanus aerogenes TaxID=660522 RepID=A0A3M0CQ43_9EURY|nr:hypothetical protein [Haloplanus aerogenes]AZH26005.1 hypothetical protein DU502_11815 [Haloplanus aerogenes]RMB11708.1 hypothetical protein ATH50_3413 [Haloplanus aerogenes]
MFLTLIQIDGIIQGILSANIPKILILLGAVFLIGAATGKVPRFGEISQYRKYLATIGVALIVTGVIYPIVVPGPNDAGVQGEASTDTSERRGVQGIEFNVNIEEKPYDTSGNLRLEDMDCPVSVTLTIDLTVDDGVDSVYYTVERNGVDDAEDTLEFDGDITRSIEYNDTVTESGTYTYRVEILRPDRSEVSEVQEEITIMCSEQLQPKRTRGYTGPRFRQIPSGSIGTHSIQIIGISGRATLHE